MGTPWLLGCRCPFQHGAPRESAQAAIPGRGQAFRRNSRARLWRGMFRGGGAEPGEGLLAEARELRRKFRFAQEADEFVLGRIHTVGMGRRRRCGESALCPACMGWSPVGGTGAAGAQQLRDAELRFDVFLQAREVPMLAQKAGETATGGRAWIAEIGRKVVVGWGVG